MGEIIDFTTRRRVVGLAPLHYRVQYLIDMINELHLLKDGRFTFPDGDTWIANDKIEWPPQFEEVDP